jgi:hypothetical protein
MFSDIKERKKPMRNGPKSDILIQIQWRKDNKESQYNIIKYTNQRQDKLEYLLI